MSVGNTFHFSFNIHLLFKISFLSIYHIYFLGLIFIYTSFGHLQHATSYDVLNNLDAEEPDESSPVHYHLPPSPQFEHVENFGNAISSEWILWLKHTIGYSSGEFVASQVFNSKSVLQEAAKIYSIKAHQ